MTKRASDVDATRRQIIEAGLDVAEEGIDALTVSAVADRADVAVRTVYNHFESRDGLIAAVLRHLIDETRSSVLAIDVPAGDPREQLLAFVSGFQASYEEQGRAVPVLLGALDVPAVAAAVEEVRTWRRQQLRRLVRAADAAALLAVPVKEAVSLTYLATAHATYDTLVRDLGLAPATARVTVCSMVERALFRPGQPGDGA